MQFIGPSYQLESRPASVQRTINMVPVPLEPGNERAPWVFKDVPGLVLGVTSWTVAPPGPSAVLADIDWTIMPIGFGARPPFPVTMFGGSTEVTFEPGKTWLGPTDPACGAFPAIVGCVPGVNMLGPDGVSPVGSSQVLDPASPVFAPSATVQSIQIDFAMQIRFTTTSFRARFEFQNGFELTRIDFVYQKTPLIQEVRVWGLEVDLAGPPLFEAPLSYTTAGVGSFPQKVRLDFGAPAGSANENFMRLFAWTGSAWSQIGSFDTGTPAVREPVVNNPGEPRFRVQAVSIGADAGLFNVERVALVPWTT